MSSKVCGVFSNCQNLLANLSPVLQTAGDTNINRTFYELLTRYAVYLNECDRRDPTILYTVSFFATCPSPYILKASLKRYTLVVDLDETLLHSVLVQGRFITKYRPGTTEFLRQVAEHYEIIVFTSSL